VNMCFCSYDFSATLSYVIEKNGGDDGTRTRGLCRDSIKVFSLSTTYKPAGTAKVRGSRTSHDELWVGLWVERSAFFRERTGSAGVLSHDGDRR
jgi:hypothetical protein